MQREQLDLTEDDGYAALREHVRGRALAARAKHGSQFGEAELRRLLADHEVMRFPTKLSFDARDLLPGEFGWARPLGERPSDGFALLIHPHFEERWDVLPLLVAYHVVAINYLDVVTNEEAELFGATLCGLDREAYYEQVCTLADSIPGAAVHDPQLEQRFEEACATLGSTGSGLASEQAPGPVSGQAGCGGSCSCKGA